MGADDGSPTNLINQHIGFSHPSSFAVALSYPAYSPVKPLSASVLGAPVCPDFSECELHVLFEFWGRKRAMYSHGLPEQSHLLT